MAQACRRMGELPGTEPPSADRCPSCGAVVSGHRCLACGLPLDGPAAVRLWHVDETLHRLALERRDLIDALRSSASDPDRSATAASPPLPPPPPPAPFGVWAPRSGAPGPGSGPAGPVAGWPEAGEPPALPSFSRRRRSEFLGDADAPPLQVQTVLLSLGAFSLIVAAVVFLAVTWRGLSAPTKFSTLVGLTALFAGFTTLLRRKSLSATAEAIAAVTVMLGLADAYAVRIGLVPHSDRFLFWGVACGALAMVLFGFAQWSGAVVARLAAVVLVQLAAPLLAAARSTSKTLLLAVLLLQALAVVEWLRRGLGGDRLVVRPLQVGGGVAWLVGAIGAGSIALSTPSERPVTALLLLIAATVAAVVAWRWPEPAELQLGASCLASALFLGAGATLAARWVDGHALALTTVVLGVVVAGVAARVDRRWATGPVAVAAMVAVGASVPCWPELGAALRAPWYAGSRFGEWSLAAGRSAHGVGIVEPTGASPGLGLAFLSTLAVGAAALRPRVGRLLSNWSIAVVGGLAASVLPFALGATVWGATAVLLATSVLVTALVLWRVTAGDTSDALLPWWAVAVSAAGQGLVWSLLTPGLTLAALAVITAIAAASVVAGVRRQVGEVALGASAVMSLAAAAAVPVAARVIGAAPATGWTALGVLAAAAAALCFIGWYRSTSAGRDVTTGVAAVGGGVAGAAYVVGATGAGRLFERAGAPGMLAAIFVAGSLAALAVAATSVRHRLVTVANAATLLATSLALAATGMAAVQAGLAVPSVWLAVVVAAGVTSVVAMLIEMTVASVDLAGAVDAAAVLGAATAFIGLSRTGSADQISLALLVVTIALAAAATRPSRRGAAAGAAAGALVLLWQRLALAGVTTAEAFTLPAAAFLAGVGIWRHRTAPEASSWTTWGPALLVALGPSVVLALRDPGLLRPVSTVIAAAAVTLVGARWEQRAPVAIGAVALVVLGGQQLGPFVRQLPRWVTFAAVGTILLLVGASYERRRAQLVGLRAHYRRLH